MELKDIPLPPVLVEPGFHERSHLEGLKSPPLGTSSSREVKEAEEILFPEE